MALAWLDPNRIAFPDVENALSDPNGLLAIGGALSPDWLIAAYQRGIFPWFEANQPILWWTPDPRMVLFPEQLHVSRTLARLIRKNPYKITIDHDFAGVIEGCAEPRSQAEGTWITRELQAAYVRLHQLGIAHSVEAWDGDRLAGGLYGVALGQVFFGESMFSRRSNSSKLALVFLVEQLRKWGYQLIDCQVASRHLASLGAREIPRREFMEIVSATVGQQRSPGYWPKTDFRQMEEQENNEF